MAPSPFASPMPTSSTSKTQTSPPPPRYEPKSDYHPPPLPKPRLDQQPVVPGPNAFAQRLKEEAAQNEVAEARLRKQSSPSDELYSVSMYKGMQPSPTLRGGGFDAQHRNTMTSSKSNSSKGISDATSGSPIGNPFWQHPEVRSDFSQRLQRERTRLDPDTRKRFSPPEREDARLKLIPSPDPDTHLTPTHRLHLDERSNARLEQNPTPHASSPSDALTTQGQPSRSRSRTPKPLQLEHSNRKAIPLTSASPKKTFFSKLGLGGPSLKPTPPRSRGPVQDPTKPDVASIRNVPPKAARILGTQSLGSRHGDHAANAKRGEVQREDSRSPEEVSPVMSENVRRINSVPSNQLFDARNADVQTMNGKAQGGNEPIRVTYDPIEENATPERGFTGGREEDDDLPPTPPSKSTLHERYSEQGQKTRGAADPSVGSVEDTDESTILAPLHASSKSAPKLRQTGYISRPNIVHQTVGEKIAQRTLEACEFKTATTKASPDSPFRSSPRRIRNSPSPQHTPPKAASEGIMLPASVYTPSCYQVQFAGGQPSPYSHLSVSPSELRPSPLHITSHMHQEQSSPSSGSDQKSRDASKSTSASVPIFLETPSTANPGSAALYDLHTAKSLPNPPQTEQEAGADNSRRITDPSSIARGLTTQIPQIQSQQGMHIRTMSPTSSRPRPSYETMTDKESHTDVHESPAPAELNIEQSSDFPAELQYYTGGETEADTSGESSYLWQEMAKMLQDILKNQMIDKASVARVEGALRVLYGRVEELRIDVRSVLQFIDVKPGRNEPGDGNGVEDDGLTHAENRPGGTVDGQFPTPDYGGNGGHGAVPTRARSHATWGPGNVDEAGPERHASPSRNLRSLPVLALGHQREIRDHGSGGS